jgi:hypothetical protein
LAHGIIGLETRWAFKDKQALLLLTREAKNFAPEDWWSVGFFTLSLRFCRQFRLVALRQSAQTPPHERVVSMGDLTAIVFGLAIFVALFLYVPACEAV